MLETKEFPAPRSRTIAGRSGPSFTCKIACDSCRFTETFSATTSAQLDALIEQHGWTRFAPTGSDLCHKCKGSSPNTIIQVRRPL